MNKKSLWHIPGPSLVSSHCDCASEEDLVFYNEKKYNYSLDFCLQTLEGAYREKAICKCRNCGQIWEAKTEEIPGGHAIYVYKRG